MNRLILAALVAGALAAHGCAEPLDPLLAADGLWSQKQGDFMQAAEKYGYEWTSNTKDSARTDFWRAASRSQDARETAKRVLTAFGLPVVESVARFEGDKLSQITVVFYSRGDIGDWPEPKFDRLVRAATDALATNTGVKFNVREAAPGSIVQAEGLSWTTTQARFLLEFSKTKDFKAKGIPFRAEFVRLEITPPGNRVSLLASATNTQRAGFSGLVHVKRDGASGDVWLADVPMVDQGEKGYCVVAATERVMRYYGDSVDENELAQVTGSSSEGGTSTGAMLDALKKLSNRLKIRVREVEKFDARAILQLMADYDRVAKRDSKRPLRDPALYDDVNGMYHDMDPAVLREARTKNKSDLHRFQREIQAHVDEGIPLLWMVMLGKVSEPGIPQNAGGHMRLIIGYNNSKNEILYSDSWGAGHELKRMTADDAWTITTGTMSIEPLN